MDFGKVPDPDRVRFDFPDDDARSRKIMTRWGAGAREVFFGAPVWACPEWKGKVYPSKAPAKDYLKHYSRRFSAIELNSTFYRVPEEKGIHAWREQTPGGFKFCPKIPQQISRAIDLGTRANLSLPVAKAFAAFGDQLGMSFLQLPPGFAPHHLPALGVFLEKWPKEIPLAVEFRHPGWFRNHFLIDPVFELLSSHSTSAVITDTSGRRDVLHTSLTSRKLLVRFVGNELHPSDFTRLDDWVARLGPWLTAGLDEVYFFLHHETYVNVPELCDDFVRKMNAKWKLELPEARPIEEQLALI